MVKRSDIFHLMRGFITRIDLAIRIVDESGTVMWMNQALATLLNCELRASIQQKEDQILSQTHAQISTALRSETFKLMTHLDSMEIQVQVNGEPAVLRESVYPFIQADNTKYSAIITEDISAIKRLEESIKKDKEYQKAVLSRLPLIFYIMNAEGVILLTDGAGLSTLGLKPGELIGQSILEVYQDNSEFVAVMQEVIQGKRDHGVVNLENNWFETWFTHIFADDGELNTILGAAIEISTRVVAESALKESESRLRMIFDHSPIGIAQFNTSGQVVLANSTLENLIGYSTGELQKMSYEDYTHPDDIEQNRQYFQELVSGERNYFQMQKRYIHKDGHHVWSILRMSVARDDENQNISIIGMAADISDQIRAEQSLERTEVKMEALFDHAQYPIGLSLKGETITVNPAYATFFGYDNPEELKGRTILEIFADSEQARIKNYIQKRARGEDLPFFYETIGRRKDGSLFQMEVRISVYPLSGVLHTVMMVQDITQRKEAEAEIERANVDLKRALDELKELKDRIEAENVILREEVRLTNVYKNIIGQSDSMQSILVQAEQVAKTDSTVLILGETGTGKELLARAIHEMSNRKNNSLIVVNCAAMPATLVESELFGREKGAFTGAITRQIGRFEIADGATIFLDEIGELPLETQSKLLRVLQEGQFERLGSSKTISVNVRIIAATNRDLTVEVNERRFREDLFYRLNVFPLHLPPLKDRLEDIQPLVWTFIDQFAEDMGKRIKKLSVKSVRKLETYDWPGNIRELRNVIERAMIKATTNTLSIELPDHPQSKKQQSKKMTEMERQHILSILEETRWKIRGPGGAAEILDMKPTTLTSRMQRLGIQRLS